MNLNVFFLQEEAFYSEDEDDSQWTEVFTAQQRPLKGKPDTVPIMDS